MVLKDMIDEPKLLKELRLNILVLILWIHRALLGYLFAK